MPGGDGHHAEARKGRRDRAAGCWCLRGEEKSEKEKQRVNTGQEGRES